MPFRTCVDGCWEPRAGGRLPDGCQRVSDGSQQADLVTSTAWSGGIVRLGRTETGDVVALVVTSGTAGSKA
ncbi:hypothetical protein ACH4KT_09505 [Streptomyces anulatus]